MADTTKLAAEILEMVGGAENVTFVAHCMTRLRFNLKDESIVDDAKVKAIDGVIDIRHSAGQYQVIVGPKVDKVYEIVAKETGVDTGKSAADEGETKGFLGKLMKLISGIMMPVLPALIACGMINAVLSILTTAGVVSAESGIYTLLYGMGTPACISCPFSSDRLRPNSLESINISVRCSVQSCFTRLLLPQLELVMRWICSA